MPLWYISKLGQHQIRTYGFYSNKHRGVIRKTEAKVAEKSAEVFKKSRSTWAMLIKMIFEVDPLICPECGGEMKIISIIDHQQKEVLKHNFNNENKFSVSLIVHDILECVGLWHESSPPKLVPLLSQLARKKVEFEEDVVLDENYFDDLCG